MNIRDPIVPLAPARHSQLWSDPAYLKESYTLPGYTKKSNKNNSVISYLSYTQSVSLAF